MIPKLIHYCWFGRKQMPELTLKCIESWKRFLPEYQLKLWNEDSFNINSNTYVKEAYNAKKFAFVTDYVRLHALYTEGGIYMDTDVEVLKGLDPFLHLPAFSGFEDEHSIPTGIMGSEKHGVWVEWQMKYYDNKSFLLANGTFDLTTNVITIGNSMKEKGFTMNNKLQNFQGMITIYPKDFFCPKSYKTKKIILTKNTYVIHHFAGSWCKGCSSWKDKIWILMPVKMQSILHFYRHYKKLK